jgi:hypothetical protein
VSTEKNLHKDVALEAGREAAEAVVLGVGRLERVVFSDDAVAEPVEDDVLAAALGKNKRVMAENENKEVERR